MKNQGPLCFYTYYIRSRYISFLIKFSGLHINFFLMLKCIKDFYKNFSEKPNFIFHVLVSVFGELFYKLLNLTFEITKNIAIEKYIYMMSSEP